MKVYSENFNPNVAYKPKNEHLEKQFAFDEKLNEEVAKFKNDLCDLGAVKFLEHLNSQKIEEKISQKEKELRQTLGVNDKNLSAKDRLNLEKTINKMLEDYRKEIYASLENNTILQYQNRLKNSSALPNLADLIGLV